MTAYYVTSRSEYTQVDAKDALDTARMRSDRSLSQLLIWPGTGGSDAQSHSDDKMFRSKPLFAAFLGHHRLDVKHGAYFWDEIQYYTDIIDVLLGWFNRASDELPDTDLNSQRRIWQLMNAYGYLLGAVSYLGAEQALCTVFHAIVCFSHRETFYYANFSFAGEALYRLYRQAYPASSSDGGRGADWRTASHQSVFPELYACRMEILADLDYIGMTSDPSSCSYGRKNETRFIETDALTIHEAGALTEAVLALVDRETADSLFNVWTSAAALAGSLAYVVVTHVIRCGCILCANSRLRDRRKEKLAKFQTASSQLDQLNSLRGADGAVNSGGDCCAAAACHKPPPRPPTPVDASSNHRLTTVATADNSSNNLKLLFDNNSCNHHTPSSFVALKVASV